MSTFAPKFDALTGSAPVIEGRGVPFRLVFGEAPSAYLDVYPPRLTPEAFWEFCQMNPDVTVEQDAAGRLVVMTPAGWESSNIRSDLGLQLSNWNFMVGEPGYTADASTGYRLPNGATRAPDASWTLRARIDALTPDERQRFAPLCPDFVIELMSPSDSLTETQAKMEEYRDNGARLVEVYRPGQNPRVLQGPASVPCEPELPGFVLDMSRIF